MVFQEAQTQEGGPNPRWKAQINEGRPRFTKHEERPKPRFSDNLPVQISQPVKPISLNCTVRSSCNFITIQQLKRAGFRSKCALLSAVRFYFFPLLLFSMRHSPLYSFLFFLPTRLVFNFFYVNKWLIAI